MPGKTDLNNMQRSKIDVYIHYVWTTKNREPYLIDSSIERRIHRCIRSQAEKLECDVLALSGMPDHIHLLIRLASTASLAQVAKQCKGVSSTFARAQLFGGNAFDWQDNYAAISVSPWHLQKVVDYVDNQKQHHAQGTTSAVLEQCIE